MNTQAIKQFDVMSTELLVSVEGGNELVNTAGVAAGAIVGYGVCAASIAAAPLAGACAYIGAKFMASGYLIARYS
ncbi:Blp family class II bacteriocin [Streptococcus merionis]|uniref:Blp family class II bacteriocin n=1 Tax=Streptococcus merionis TaxID=400065 RepID=UPI003519033D